MWHPWSKKNLCLSIAPNGVALRDAAGKRHFLPSEQDLVNHFSSIDSLLEKQKHVLKQQRLEVVLAHSFVRFLVLPWQQVAREQDWQAIAQHALKKTFGNSATDWQVRLQFAGFQQPVVAAALDNETFSGLQQMAQRFEFTIERLKPLASQYHVPHLKSLDWLLYAEPQRLTLVRVQNGVWQQVWVDAPPAQFEQQHAEQLLQRSMLQFPQAQHTQRIAAVVSAELKNHWQKKSPELLHQINMLNQQEPHAMWMERL